jgi:sarcosine oxidase gamma subunit
MKTSAFIPALAAGLALFCLAACDEHEESPPTVQFVTPTPGATVTGPDVFVRVATTNFKFAHAAAKSSAVMHDEAGHIHLFLDRPVGLDAQAAGQMHTSDTLTLTGISPGLHYLIAQGAGTTHAGFAGMKDSVAFIVK